MSNEELMRRILKELETAPSGVGHIRELFGKFCDEKQLREALSELLDQREVELTDDRKLRPREHAAA